MKRLLIDLHLLPIDALLSFELWTERRQSRATAVITQFGCSLQSGRDGPLFA